jgi:molybdopterin synthase sulfur carrier subunit
MLEVRLFAYFRDNRDKVLHLKHEDFPDTQRILDYLHIDLTAVAILLVNGRHAKADVPLQDGDIVALFPPVAGG